MTKKKIVNCRIWPSYLRNKHIFVLDKLYDKDPEKPDENDEHGKREIEQKKIIIMNNLYISLYSAVKYDIIKFYNVCYVRSMQDFVINTNILLSPLPPYHRNQLLSPRKISEHHSLYIQPMESKEFPQSPNSLTYSFKASPVNVS